VGQDTQIKMREYVLAQALTELATRAHVQPSAVEAGAVRLERVTGIAEGLDLWRATLPSDHSHPYLLASVNDKVLRLGGFAAPELSVVTSQLARGTMTDRDARGAAEQLALLADPNGAIQRIFVDRGDQPEYVSTVVTAWRRRAPRDWPPDTVTAVESGGWFVRLTLLSRATRSYTLHWMPFAYCFAFDGEGRLLAWTQRAGEIFGVAGIPIAQSGATGRP
jgi:hypothetical protein